MSRATSSRLLAHLAAFAFACAFSVPPLAAHEANDEMAQAANNFLVALTPEQRERAQFEFADSERKDWHYVPRPRNGLPIRDMTQEQRLLAHALLATGMSTRGYAKGVSIMSLEKVLAVLENVTDDSKRNPENYFFSIFGTPGGAEPWGLRVEGHHLALNFTSVGASTLAVTPSFLGSNPAEVKSGPRAGTRVLAAEEDLGRALVASLSDDQKKVAILTGEAPADVLNNPNRVDPTKPEGIPQSQLTAQQTTALVMLVKEYLGRARPEIAAEEWAKVEKAGLARLHFVWIGGTERGQPHYYRVQGGNFVLEYDNTQNDANHVHSLWRDFDHDFGADLLKAHLDADHQGD